MVNVRITLPTIACTLFYCSIAAADKPADWAMFGQNFSNTASTTQSGITTANVAKLKTKWAYTTAGDVSARAAVVNGVAYFPDWGGALNAVNANNGKKIWSVDLGQAYAGAQAVNTVHSRTSPAVVNGIVYIGTQEGAKLLAINAADGQLKWATQLETADPLAMVTASPVVYNGVVYTGVASNQEPGAAFGFPCCSGRGSVVAVDAVSGAIKWQTYTTPAGYSGAGVWGSNFVVDPSRNTLYVGTGNNYSEPTDPAYLSCISGGGTKASCASPANHVDSILALNLTSGQIKWATKEVTWHQPQFLPPPLLAVDGSDDWNVACFFPAPNQCPSSPGPDYDFASAPNLITYQSASGPKTILGAGQKSGIYYAYDPDTGVELWRTQVGPGSSLGGMEWGSASDGKRIYVAIANFYGLPYTLFGGVPATGSAGSIAALDPATGNILWQTPDPNGAINLGPLAVADGVVYAPSMAGAATAPTMLALDASSGVVLWGQASGSSVNAGATIVNGVVYWGSGYAHLGIEGYTGNNKFFAFSVNGN